MKIYFPDDPIKQEMLEWVIERIDLENLRIKEINNYVKYGFIIARIEFIDNKGKELIERATGLKIEEILNG